SAAVTKFAQGTGRGPAGNAIQVEIQGEDLGRAQEVSTRIQAWFMANPGVFDVGDNLDPGSEQVRVRLKPGAGSTGLTGTAVAQQVRSALAGVQVQTFHTQGEDYELYVELERRGRDTLADLELLPIAVTPGVNLPLGSIASIDVRRSLASLIRRDSVRTVTVTGSVAPDVANAAEVMGRFMAEAAPRIELEFPDVRLATGGAAK